MDNRDNKGRFIKGMSSPMKGKKMDTERNRFVGELALQTGLSEKTVKNYLSVIHMTSQNLDFQKALEYIKSRQDRKPGKGKKSLRQNVLKHVDGYLNYKEASDKFEVGYLWALIPEEDIVVIDGLKYIPESYTFERKKSRPQNDVADFVKSIYNGEVLVDSRSIIPPMEIDIYIPEKKVAIEFNGLYWHSSYNGIDMNYHLDKTRMCEEKGIRLIHIFEDEWRDKPEICKSIISSSLGIYKERIYARKCTFTVIPNEEAARFLSYNHIQGSCNAKTSYALKYNGETVQVVCFNNVGNGMELVRMASRLNTQVMGGFSRILKNQPYNSFVSYVDRRMFDGKGYDLSGFTRKGCSRPQYWYTDFHYRYNRRSFQKKYCYKRWYDNKVQDMTEEEMCSEHNLFKIYGCGTVRVEWNRV